MDAGELPDTVRQYEHGAAGVAAGEGALVRSGAVVERGIEAGRSAIGPDAFHPVGAPAHHIVCHAPVPAVGPSVRDDHLAALRAAAEDGDGGADLVAAGVGGGVERKALRHATDRQVRSGGRIVREGNHDVADAGKDKRRVRADQSVVEQVPGGQEIMRRNGSAEKVAELPLKLPAAVRQRAGGLGCVVGGVAGGVKQHGRRLPRQDEQRERQDSGWLEDTPLCAGAHKNMIP